MAEIENRTRVSLWLLRPRVYVALGSSRRCGFQLDQVLSSQAGHQTCGSSGCTRLDTL